MFITIPLFLGLAFVVPGAIRDNAISARQRTAVGIVTAYEPSSHNECQYMFIVQGRQFSGLSSSPKDSVVIGERVQVYFDSSDPATNSLEDFAEASRQNLGVATFMIFGILVFATIILYSKLVPTP